MKMLNSITIEGGTRGVDISDKEIQAYIDMGRNKFKNSKMTDITIKIIDDENVDVSWGFDAKPFERIRRITGYLVGTLDRFNNAKRAEVQDRVKHGLGTGSDLNCEDVYVD